MRKLGLLYGGCVQCFMYYHLPCNEKFWAWPWSILFFVQCLQHGLTLSEQSGLKTLISLLTQEQLGPYTSSDGWGGASGGLWRSFITMGYCSIFFSHDTFITLSYAFKVLVREFTLKDEWPCWTSNHEKQDLVNHWGTPVVEPYQR